MIDRTMIDSQPVQQIIDSAPDPFISGAILDTTGYSQETLKKMGLTRPEQKSDDSWGGIDVRRSEQGQTLSEFLANPDAESLEEIARYDPSIRERLAEDKTDQITIEFRNTNKAYLSTDTNSTNLIQGMAKKYLKADWLEDSDAIRKCYEDGVWTVANLTAMFKQLLAGGRLEVAEGSFKELSTEEKNDVVACIRSGDMAEAVMQYVKYSHSGRIPQYKSARDFLARNPELSKRAACFVFFHATAGIDAQVYKKFLREKVSQITLPTVDSLRSAWTAYALEGDLSAAAPQSSAPKAQAPINLDDLSTEEITELRARVYLERAARNRF